MAKKLLTSDENLIMQVENVLKKNKIPCARIPLHRKEDEGMLLLAVTNRNGEAMRNAIVECNTNNSKYFFGVLRNHPEYTVPKGILKKLSETKS